MATARARGLPCIEPLATGVGTDGHGFLVTATAGGEPLPRGPLEASVAQRAGALLRRCHDVGAFAWDLHPGNMIDDGVRVCLVDLTGVRWSDEPIADEVRARGLAFFCSDLDGGIADAAARPLVEAYAPTEAVLATADRIGQRLRARGLLAFGRRAFRNCRHTSTDTRRRAPSWYWYRPAEPLHDAARELVEHPERATPIKSGRRGAVGRFQSLVVKTRTAAAARRLFEAAYWLEFAGVPRPDPVVCQTFRDRGTVVSHRLPGPTAAELVEAGAEADWSMLAGRLGDAVGRMHAHGLRNRDLKFDNLVVSPNHESIAMVDLDGVRRRTRGEQRGRAHDLGRLLAAWTAAGAPGGAAARARFLLGYARALARLRQRTAPKRLRAILRTATDRAAAWASAHPTA